MTCEQFPPKPLILNNREFAFFNNFAPAAPHEPFGEIFSDVTLQLIPKSPTGRKVLAEWQSMCPQLRFDLSQRYQAELCSGRRPLASWNVIPAQFGDWLNWNGSEPDRLRKPSGLQRSRSLNSRSGTSLFYQSQERPTVPRGRSRILARDATSRCWSQVNRERRAARRSFARSSGRSCSACGRAEVRSRVQPKSCEMNSSWLLNRSIRHASGCHSPSASS